jgi:diguanylate cyclase (GGDEF)-like protein
MVILNFLESFEKRNKLFVIAVGFALIGVLGFLDFLTGYEFAFSLFYLIPISLITWFTGQRIGIVASFVSTLVWIISDVVAENPYLHIVIYSWNILMGLCFFVIVTLLLSTLRRALEHEKELSHTDFLTGAVNSRVFYDSLQTEINRSQRYKNPFTIAYIDLDKFKTVNDEFGHATGDQVLRFVVNRVRKHLRKTDVVTRLGGDEFALLLPETNQESAQVVLSKLQYDILVGMQQNNWPVTLSIGVLTCIDAPSEAEEIIRMVDDLMYSVKRGSKNDIKYAIYKN